ncbi:ABC transporter ATP-binding protein [Novipirellula artificiosorum]|uniref:ABC transporter ATP-binding protein YtrB n=1 Tax=Novipirellula artificiosorum TaxID=2528016 RepID=A0A5C6DCF6_9BACT|nr:ABC transporter ATP-binding protein [Novipirellula artificiosorum]TWU34432.1 ABC transporter ATP-binding protein YtrB [Novipirellula artificiosorum]
MNHVITTTDLTMRFRGCDALRGVDLAVQPGTVFALLGENGAGKTTMIRILTGFQKPTSGSCRVCDMDPVSNAIGVRRQIGYVSDAPALYDWMTVAEIGWFAASFYRGNFHHSYRQSVFRYEIPLDRKIRNLSKGQRAKVALSLALAHDPSLLVLDEPTSGLDPMVRRDFLESMIDRAASGRTVFLSSHQISEVERVADTIGILHEGKLRLCCPLVDLKDSMIELTVNLDDPLVALPKLPESVETLCEETYGRQRRIVVRGFTAEMHSLFTSRDGVVGTSERPLSLEEIFIAYTKGSLGPSRPIPNESETAEPSLATGSQV